MPSPPIDPVETDETLPARVDVAIIGGGIIGLCTALSLAERGLSVLVCEKGEIAGEQSSRNWGWCRASRRDPREIALAAEAVQMWSRMNAVVGAETGFRQSGILFTSDSEEELDRCETWLDAARPYQLTSRMVGGTEAAGLLEGLQRPVKGALYTPGDGRAEPQKAGPAIAGALRRMGATVVTRCAVRALDTAGGRVVGIVTERGRVAADAVVLAGGAWSRLFTMPLDLRLPQLKVHATALRTGALDGPEGAAWMSDFAFRKRLDGGYTIANGASNLVSIVPDSFRYLRDFLPALQLEWRSLRVRLDGRFREELQEWTPAAPDEVSQFERVRVLDPAPIEDMNRAAMAAATRAFPAFARARIEQQWAGMIDVTPDALPVISGVKSLPGFFIATGFSGHGFGIAPAAGRLCADLVTGAAPLVDPAAFRLSRFSDGSRPRPTTSV